MTKKSEHVLIVEERDDRASDFRANLTDDTTERVKTRGEALKLLTGTHRFNRVCLAGQLLLPSEAKELLMSR